jgi:hypothetical protein
MFYIHPDECINCADPSQGRVRQELAHTLFLMGDDDRARYHFEFLKSTVDSEQLRAAYDRFLIAIRNRRPWTLDGYVGFAPSTNINDGAPGETVYIASVPFTNANAARSGVGLSYGLSGSYRFDLDPQWSLTFGGSLSGASYTQSRFDRLNLRAYSEVSRNLGGWRLGAGIAGERSFSGLSGECESHPAWQLFVRAPRVSRQFPAYRNTAPRQPIHGGRGRNAAWAFLSRICPARQLRISPRHLEC